MIQYPLTLLDGDIQLRLNEYQAAVDQTPDYAERVKKASRAWDNKNTRIFSRVKQTLTEMCSGSCRCMYCEDSCADEVEHIKPKNLYPEEVFVWDNYAYACGPCNNKKRDKFAVFSKATGNIVDVSRSHNAPITPPETGEPVLINPRSENAFDFLELDITGTFRFRVTSTPNTREYERGIFTQKTLDINREVLVKARKSAYKNYRARLREYIILRDEAVHQGVPDEMILALQAMEHPTVWREMKRKYQLIEELKDLFEQAKEALEW